MKRFVVAALAALMFAVPAHADDAVTYRIEAHGGWDRVAQGGGGDDGLLYGIAIGADVPIGSMAFIGFEAGADLGSAKQCVQLLGASVCDEAKRDLSAVARVGFTVGGGVKLYALGGYSNARIKETATLVVFPGPITVSSSSNGNGLRAGAGAEIKLGKAAYTKLEYRYTNYEHGFSRHQVVAGIGLGL